MDHFAARTNNNNNNNHTPVSGKGSQFPGLKDEREGCRSLVCDANGIIIAESVYRCMICSSVLDSIADAKIHYHNNHIDNDMENSSCSDPLLFPEEDLSLDLSSDEGEGGHLNPGHQSLSHSYSVGVRGSQHHPHHGHHSDHNMSGYGSSASGHGNTTSSVRKKVTRKPGAQSSSSAVVSTNNTNTAVVNNAPISNVKIETSGTNGTCTIKSGYITCPVCSCTKFYTTLQRRYGQFSCVGCYRFFKEFFVKPKRYGCPNLGTCPLDVRTKCKGCWIKKCIDTYSVDEQRKSLLMAHRPVKKTAGGNSGTGSQMPVSKSPASSGAGITRQQQQQQHQQNMGNNTSSNNINSIIASPVNDSSNENIEPHPMHHHQHDMQEDMEDEEEDEEEELTGGHAPDHQLSPAGGGPVSKKIKSEPSDSLLEPNVQHHHHPQHNNNNNGSIGVGGEEDEENQSLEDVDADFGNEDTENEGSSLLMPASSAPAYESGSLMDSIPSSPLPTRSGKTPPRRKTSGRIKNWCCLKCANCLADDCGKCINCLDRPKFGGPFIRKQRCLYKKCLMKTKPIPNNSSF